MSKNVRASHLLYLLIAPCVGIITVVLRTLALLTEFDPTIGFYDTPTLSIVNTVLLAVITAALAIFTYEMRSHLSFERDYRDLPTLFSGVFLGIMLIFFGITMLAEISSDSPLAAITLLLPVIAALSGAALFILRAFDGAAEGTAKAMLTLPLAAFGIFFSLYLSTEGSLMLNAPAKLLGITAWISASFFFLGEARIALGRAKWPLHSFCTVTAVIFTATLAIPNLIYHASTGIPLLGNTAHDFVALGVFLYALARLCTTVVSALRVAAPGTAYIIGKETEHHEETANEEASDR